MFKYLMIIMVIIDFGIMIQFIVWIQRHYSHKTPSHSLPPLRGISMSLREDFILSMTSLVLVLVSLWLFFYIFVWFRIPKVLWFMSSLKIIIISNENFLRSTPITIDWRSKKLLVMFCYLILIVINTLSSFLNSGVRLTVTFTLYVFLWALYFYRSL